MIKGFQHCGTKLELFEFIILHQILNYKKQNIKLYLSQKYLQIKLTLWHYKIKVTRYIPI